MTHETNGTNEQAEPLTDDLLQKIIASPSAEAYVTKHEDLSLDLPTYLARLLNVRNMRQVDAVHAAGLNETYGYQIFKGQRHPSRDKVLQLALGMGCSLDETQHLLMYADAGALYAKNRRDAIVLYGISHGLSLQQVDEELYRFGEATLTSE